MKIYVVRADYGTYTESFLKNGYIGIGWLDHPLEDFTDREEIRKYYENKYPDDVPNRKYQNVGQINRFLNEIVIGDLVMTPFADNRLIVGIVEGKPYFLQDGTSEYDYRRKVKWFKKVVDRTGYSIPLQNTLRSSLTVFSVSQINEVLESISLPSEKVNEVQYDINLDRERVYTQIKKKFLDLNSEEFEILVSYVLRSLGFEARQKKGHPGDGGIDFEGELNVLGIASINLQVQVKRHDTNTTGEKEIRSFRGALKRDFQGCFITLSDYNKKAKASACDTEKIPINLINGSQFIDIFIEQYDKITDALIEDDNEDLLSKLKFKKILLPE